MSTVDIEKESLEAHVELCAERYSRMEEKFENVEKRLSSVETVLVEIKDCIQESNNRRHRENFKYAVGAIGFLASGCAGLVFYLLVQ